MEHEFKAGDVVQLKSGGPEMTIEGIGAYTGYGETHDRAKCVWFEGKKRMEDMFEFVTLKVAQARSSTASVGQLGRG